MQTSSILADSERERIRAEEQLRAEVRKELTDTPRPPETLDRWTFLNSKFGLWLLTAVFITGVGSVYKIYDEYKKAEAQIDAEKRAKESARIARIDRLSMEFSYRLSGAMIALQEAHAAVQSAPNRDRNAMRISALASMLKPSSDRYPPLFPEFSNYSGMALVADMRTLANVTEAERLKEKLAELSGLLNDPTKVDLNNSAAFSMLAGKLVEAAKYPRWGNGFYYTDCDKTKPFC